MVEALLVNSMPPLMSQEISATDKSFPSGIDLTLSLLNILGMEESQYIPLTIRFVHGPN